MMGDAADDAYDAAMRIKEQQREFMDNVQKSCEYSILGHKPCRIVSNELPQEEVEMRAALEADGEKLRQLTGEDHGPYFDDTSPYKCGYCGKEFDYP